METFVLLPFFLLARVPLDADTWSHGPEYTFVADAKTTTLQGRSILDIHVYHVYSKLKCRPRDFETLHCQFHDSNITMYMVETDVYRNVESCFHMPFDIKFDQQGIRNLVVHQQMNHWYADIIRAFVSQLNFGVMLLHKPDDAFKTTENTYLGQCESLVNISREDQGNENSEKEDYEIVPMTGLQKKRGEILMIEKTKNLENCTDKRDYMTTGGQDHRKSELWTTQMLSSISRIEISNKVFDSYTENMIDVTYHGITFSFHDKISLNLVSVLPAKEALEPLSKNTTTISPYVYSEIN